MEQIEMFKIYLISMRKGGKYKQAKSIYHKPELLYGGKSAT